MPETVDAIVRRSLESQTFEPDELRELLVEQGHDRATVTEAIERVSHGLAARELGPANQARLASTRTGARLIRVGVFVLMAGLAYTLMEGGMLLMLLVVALGGGLIAAGYRSARI